jgi:hypothetical protein
MAGRENVPDALRVALRDSTGNEEDRAKPTTSIRWSSIALPNARGAVQGPARNAWRVVLAFMVQIAETTGLLRSCSAE